MRTSLCQVKDLNSTEVYGNHIMSSKTFSILIISTCCIISHIIISILFTSYSASQW